jgi:hypothetical protein
MDAIFNDFFQAIGYDFFVGVCGLAILYEFLYTFYEQFDML